jgi:hypothetical protein
MTTADSGQGRGREAAGEFMTRRAGCLNWARPAPWGPEAGNRPGLPDQDRPMKLPRVWFTMRRMMVLIAIAALLASFERLRQRSRAYSKMALGPAINYAKYCDEYINRQCEFCKMAPATFQYEYKQLTIKAAYQEQLWHKYERAARYPWLPVAPDPPEPK